jgi:hypothetical protein
MFINTHDQTLKQEISNDLQTSKWKRRLQLKKIKRSRFSFDTCILLSLRFFDDDDFKKKTHSHILIHFHISKLVVYGKL